MRKREEWGGGGGWLRTVRGRINGLFDSQVNIYTFCLRLSYTPILQPPWEMHYFPPILSCNRILSGFFFPLFHSVSLTSSLSTHSLYYSAQLQREERGVGSFLWDSAGERTEEAGVYSPRLAAKIASQLQRRSQCAIGRICSPVSALSFNFTEYVCLACDNHLLERSDCLAIWLGCWRFCSSPLSVSHSVGILHSSTRFVLIWSAKGNFGILSSLILHSCVN